jgi:archaellum component FlaC
MSIREYDSEQELDDDFERIEEINFEHLALKEAVDNARNELKEAEKELERFEEDYKEELLG